MMRGDGLLIPLAFGWTVEQCPRKLFVCLVPRHQLIPGMKQEIHLLILSIQERQHTDVKMPSHLVMSPTGLKSL